MVFTVWIDRTEISNLPMGNRGENKQIGARTRQEADEVL